MSVMTNDLETILADVSISKVLNELLTKLDAQALSERCNSLSVAINEKNFSELFTPSSVNEEQLLEKKIYALVKLGVFEIKRTKRASFLPLVQQKAKLIFNGEFEEQIRVFYGREISNDPWLEALNSFEIADKNLLELLEQNSIKIKGRSDYEIIERLLEWAEGSKSKSARKESSKCFWGLSKVFDKQEAYKNYFGLEDMPISLLVHFQSAIIEQVLFIENQDTFYEACESEHEIFKNTVIIYASGFKASAKRIRHRRGSKMYFSFNSKDTKESLDVFLKWFYKESDNDLAVYFWGDFDYAGMDILKAFKVNFEHIDAWEMGYKSMVKAIKNNFGHTPMMAGKERQAKIDSDFIGCLYADEELIPLLLNKEIFLDQEFVDI